MYSVKSENKHTSLTIEKRSELIDVKFLWNRYVNYWCFFSSFFASIYSHKNEQKVYENDFGKKFYSDNIWQAHSSEIRKWFMKFVWQQICHIYGMG